MLIRTEGVVQKPLHVQRIGNLNLIFYIGGRIQLETTEELAIIEDYTKNKINIAKLAKKYHHNSRLIIKTLDKYGIEHKRGALRKGQANEAVLRILTSEEEKIIVNIYSNGGTVKDCQDAIHTSQEVIRRCLQKYNIYKTHSEVMRELPQNQVKYPIKEEFFFTPSHNLFYLLGFLASDGCVKKDDNKIILNLASIDKSFLESLQEELGGCPIKEYTSTKGFSYAKWSFSSKRVKEELATYGIIPNKTFTLDIPVKIPEKYKIDYIRGYFDGDGSVNLIQGKSLRWQVCSATRPILEWMIETLEKQFDIPKVNVQVQNRPTNPLYYFQYSTNATEKIYEILYTDNSWYLPRKKEKFDEYIKIKK